MNTEKQNLDRGRRLKALRKQAGLSQATLGKIMGYTNATISSHEKGKTVIDNSKAALFAKHLNCSVWDILTKWIPEGTKVKFVSRNHPRLKYGDELIVEKYNPLHRSDPKHKPYLLTGAERVNHNEIEISSVEDAADVINKSDSEHKYAVVERLGLRYIKVFCELPYLGLSEWVYINEYGHITGVNIEQAIDIERELKVIDVINRFKGLFEKPKESIEYRN